ncbi:hypothetical protein [Nocardiopsis lucentensis]|uniref:hypothetical protein n=1 Tax=Nocardiopsis lucentensis TaxID=53441 RepID=UPI00034C57FE|nr:hypothetical protein [Nocardiopsis lucentensis]
MCPGHRRNRRAPLGRVRALVALPLLLAVACSMMMWVWTGAAGFAVAGGALFAVVVVACSLADRGDLLELFGGPWDGARVPRNEVRHGHGDVVLDTHDGGRAHYAPGDFGHLRYRGQVGGGG